MTLFELYTSIKLRLEPVALEEAEQQARLIICHALKIDMTQLLLNYNRQISQSEQAEVERIVEKRLTGYPLQYIFKTVEFYGLEFYVNDSVLIPRQDTETLVEIALPKIREMNYKTLLDMCCGSGCIGITLSVLGNVSATLADISSACIELSRKNAQNLGVRNIELIVSDLFDSISGKFDIITVNPPYLTQAEMQSRQQETAFEPELALFGGIDGLDFYRRIASTYKNYLNPNGALMLEIGCNQGEAVKALFDNAHIVQDINGLDRVIIVES